MYELWSILVLLFQSVIVFSSANDVPIRMCNVLSDFGTCILENIHTNKTHFDFQPVRYSNQAKVIVKNSKLQKLGKFGFCTSATTYLDLFPLNELVLNDNFIEEIHPEAFEGCKTIKTLILRNNKIEVLDENIFNQNNKLVKIDLSNNLLKNLDSEIFVNQHELKELFLSGNKLKMFRAYLVEPCSNLEVLRLDSNDIFDLDSKKIVENLPKLKTIAFNNNQLRCERVTKLIEDFKPNVVDNEYEGNVKERIQPTKTKNSIVCLEDIPWAAAHYIYMFTKITELE